MQCNELLFKQPKRTFFSSAGRDPFRVTIRRLFVTGAAALLLWSPAFAQVSTGDLTGTVTDPTGAVVPQATVTATNVATGEQRTTTTGGGGNYTLSLLPIGTYSLRIVASSFKSTEKTGIVLSAGDRLRDDEQLSLGSQSETVTATAERTTALQTDSSSVGDEIGTQAVQDLPTNGRNYVNLVQVAAGVNSGPTNAISSGNRVDNRSQTSSFSANGQSDLFNNNLIDWLDNNEREQGFTVVRPSIDGIAEIKVNTNVYTAEVGRSAGAVVNIITKAGTNQFHGTLFEYLRNDIFDARDRFAFVGVTKKPKRRQNQFGGSLGGPIFRDRTFFFADAETLRIVAGQTSTLTVPTLQEQTNLDFRDNGGPLLNPATVNPVALNIFRLYPKPNAPGLVNNFVAAPSTVQNATTIEARIDHRFSQNDLFFTRFAANPGVTTVPGGFPAVNGVLPGVGFASAASSFKQRSYSGQLNYIHIFSPTVLLETKAGYIRNNIQSLPLNYGNNVSQSLGIPNANLGTADTSGLANISVSGYTSLGAGTFVPIVDINNTFQYSGALTVVRGSHSLKIGSTLIRRQLNYSQPQGSPIGSFSFASTGASGNTMANFLATGNATSLTRANVLQKPGYRTWEPSVFFQDDWRATSKLTLNLGLRYEMYTPISEAHDKYDNFNLPTLSFIQGGKLGVGNDYSNVSPRLGFALSPSPTLVVRGGFGISYYPTDIQGVIQNVNPPFAYSYSQTATATAPLNISVGPPIPTAPDLNTFASNRNVTVLTYKPSSFRTAYIEQFNLFVQKDLGGNTIGIGYVGELGRQLLQQLNANRLGPPGAGQPVNQYRYATQLPFVTTINENLNGAVSAYHAGQVTYKRRTRAGFTVNANYTWAHGLNNTINGSGTTDARTFTLDTLAADNRYFYGNSDIDVRHRVAVGASYAIPLGNNLRGIAGAFGKGWQVNTITYWQTGLPFTVVNSVLVNGAAYVGIRGVTSDRPNQIANASVQNRGIGQWFNQQAFHAQTPGTRGSEGHNPLYGPHDRRFDFSLFKTFTLHDEVALDFRAESFNLTNTPNYAAPSATITRLDATGAPVTTGTTFGTITSTAANEIPRQFQFALKLHF